MVCTRRDIPYFSFRFFQDFALIYPVYVIMFERTGLEFVQISWLLVIWGLAVLVTEVPSGVIADLWSRRGVLFLALLLKACGFIVWLLYPSFGGFAVGFVLWGIQEGLTAGVTEALLFDSLSRQGRDREFEAIAGLGTLVARVAIAPAMILGARLFAENPQLVLLSSSAAMLVAACCALAMTGGAAARREHRSTRALDTHGSPHAPHAPHAPAAERAAPHAPHAELPPRHAAGRQPGAIARALPGTLTETLREIAASARVTLRVAGMPALVIAGSFGIVIYGVLDEYDTLFATLHGVPLAWVGVWGALRFACEGVGGVMAPRLSRLLAEAQRSYGTQRSDGAREQATGSDARSAPASNTELAHFGRFGIWMALAGVALLVATTTALLSLLPLYFLFFGMMAAAEVVFEGFVQRRVSSAGRATVGSLVSFLQELLGIGVLVLFGFVADAFGLRAIFQLGAALLLIAGSVYAIRSPA